MCIDDVIITLLFKVTDVYFLMVLFLNTEVTVPANGLTVHNFPFTLPFQ
jgi:hypothetical protein